MNILVFLLLHWELSDNLHQGLEEAPEMTSLDIPFLLSWADIGTFLLNT